MKKKFKKLALNTETLRSLANGELGDVVGATAVDTNCTAVGSVCTIPCSVCMNCSNVPTCPNMTC